MGRGRRSGRARWDGGEVLYGEPTAVRASRGYVTRSCPTRLTRSARHVKSTNAFIRKPLSQVYTL